MPFQYGILQVIIRKENLSKMKYDKYDKYQVYKPTNDCWYGNFKNNTVQLSLLLDQKYNGGKYHMVAVWGNDDSGMDIVYKGPYGKTKARRMYRKLLALPVLNQQHLLSLGFSWA